MIRKFSHVEGYKIYKNQYLSTQTLVVKKYKRWFNLQEQ